MKILVIDGQGGQLGAQIISRINKTELNADIIAVGTNTIATTSMLKAGAHHAATGENAVIVNCRHSDVIIGPIGIVIADALYGEITPKMALAIAQSQAVRILLPMNRCDNLIAGIQDISTKVIIEDAIAKLLNI